MQKPYNGSTTVPRERAVRAPSDAANDVPPEWVEQWRRDEESPYQSATPADIAWRFGRELFRKGQSEPDTALGRIGREMTEGAERNTAAAELAGAAPSREGEGARVRNLSLVAAAPEAKRSGFAANLGLDAQETLRAPIGGEPLSMIGDGRRRTGERPARADVVGASSKEESSSEADHHVPSILQPPFKAEDLGSSLAAAQRESGRILLTQAESSEGEGPIARDDAVQPPRLLNPSPGGRLRSDRHGDGAPQARRRNGRGQTYEHQGLDVTVVPGSVVRSPIDGVVTKQGTVYKDDQTYRYVEIQTPDGRFAVRVMYVDPGQEAAVGTAIVAGDPIGTAQAISEKEGNDGMQDHLHIELWDRSTETNPSETRPMDRGWTLLNPEPQVEGFQR